MSLASGARLGPYEILAPLGAGGMGEVYRARDTRLGREVAVKVLPAAFAADTDRMRRFEQEARTVAALNHPNILALHDIGTHEAAPYIVTELLEGATLREQMPVPTRKALDYAQQVCQGLAAAHAKGVTHRDLKPENLFVTSDGRVKILDFGLAKMATEYTEATETVGTTPGMAMGTIGYMSPEQARGKAADHRSDIFSLGVILYEMLAGQRAFHRDSAIETLNAILKEDPPPLEDAALERIVRRCLEKSPEQRFQSASDLGFAISALSGSTTTHLVAPAKPRLSLVWPVLVVAALVVGAAGGLWWQARREAAAPGWTGVQLGGPSIAIAPRLSPDGHTLAFVAIVDGQTQLAVMNPVSGNWTALTHERSAGSMLTISWSRDGTKIYFDRLIGSTGSIHSVPALGGDDRLVLEDAERPEVLPDGSLIVIRVNPEGQHQVHRFWPSTGNIQALPFLSSIESFGGMRAFADGQEVALLGRPLVGSQEGTSPGAYALDLKSLRTRRLLSPFTEIQGWQVLVPSADGRSVLSGVRTGNLYRVVIGARDGSGSPRTALTLTNPLSGLDVAADGSLYTTQTETSLEVLRFPVGGGVAEKLVEASIPFPPRYLLQLPDGRFLFQGFPAGRSCLLVADRGKDPVPLVETEEITAQPMALLGDRQVALLAGSDSDNLGVAVADLSNGRIVRRLARTNRLQIQSLASSPDGKTLYYGAGGGIWSIPAEDGEARKLTTGDAIAVDPHGQELVVQRFEKNGAHLFRLALQGGAEERIPFPGPLFLHGWSIASNAIHGDGRIVVLAFSPDSYWNQIVILDPKTGKAERVPVQHSGDIFAPGWTRDGRILAAGSPLKSTLWRFFRK